MGFFLSLALRQRHRVTKQKKNNTEKTTHSLSSKNRYDCSMPLFVNWSFLLSRSIALQKVLWDKVKSKPPKKNKLNP